MGAVRRLLVAGCEMRCLAHVSLFLVLACGGDPSGVRPDAPSVPDDAPADAQVDAPPGCESAGPTVTRQAFVEASVAFLRDRFERTTGFEGGKIAYGEGYVALDDSGCPKADWSALSYVVPAPADLFPVELRADHDRVAVVWTTGGRKSIAFVTSAPYAGDGLGHWHAGRLPDNVNAVVSDTVSDADAQAFHNQLVADYPDLNIVYLEAIRILTVETAIGTFAYDTPGTASAVTMERAAQALRDSGLFSALDWSGHNFRIPFEFWVAAEQTTETLVPECLRQETKPMLPEFTTSPSFAPPLGPGPTAKTPVCI